MLDRPREGFLRRTALAFCCIGPCLVSVLGGSAAAQEIDVAFRSMGDVARIKVTTSKSVTVKVNSEFKDLVVGDPEIAEVMPLTNNSLYVLGKKDGRTNIAAYNEERKLVGVIDVDVSMDVREVNTALRAALPKGGVTASLVNGRIKLSGKVSNGIALRTALDTAQQFSASPVINTVRVTDSQQVMLEVRFLEAKRTAGRELGVGWSGGDTAKGEKGVVLGVGGAGLPTGTAPFGTLIAHVLDAGVSVNVVVKALESKNLARSLAEPNLVAQSGETATFLAGGEVPIPVPKDTGGVGIEYKEYGVRLSFTPVVLDDGLINLELAPEVSLIDSSVTVSLNGGVAPAFITRRAKTTVELRDGQSFAIAGLLQSTDTRNQGQLPWLGQIPVVGALFRSTSFQKQETDLVVLITVHLVRPARPGEAFRSPLDKTKPANDAEYFLLGKVEVTPKDIRKFQAGQGASGPFGHIIDLPRGSSSAATK